MTSGEAPDTRHRILVAAAALFARQGFQGTSTREIASSVGIRQPSLFHHFATKHDILAELLDRDLDAALERIHRHGRSDSGAAARLYAYLLDDVDALGHSPFDVRGLYNDAVLEDEALSEQRAKRAELRAEVKSLVSEGIRSGEFRDVDPDFARQVITGMLLDTIWAAGRGESASDPPIRPRQVADFVLLGLLRKPGSLDKVRTAASRLAARGSP